jgi:hypothetical protein
VPYRRGDEAPREYGTRPHPGYGGFYGRRAFFRLHARWGSKAVWISFSRSHQRWVGCLVSPDGMITVKSGDEKNSHRIEDAIRLCAYESATPKWEWVETYTTRVKTAAGLIGAVLGVAGIIIAFYTKLFTWMSGGYGSARRSGRNSLRELDGADGAVTVGHGKWPISQRLASILKL